MEVQTTNILELAKELQLPLSFIERLEVFITTASQEELSQMQGIFLAHIEERKQLVNNEKVALEQLHKKYELEIVQLQQKAMEEVKKNRNRMKVEEEEERESKNTLADELLQSV